MDSMTTSLEELQTRRRELAFRVAQGHAELENELDATEDAIDRLRRQQERQRIATEEGQHRRQAEALEQAAAERQRKEAQLTALHAARRKAASQVEEHVDRLVRMLDDYGQLGRDIYALAAELSDGRPRAKLLGIEQAANFLAWRLADRLPLGARPAHESRRPLRELLGYAGDDTTMAPHDFQIGNGA